MPWESQNDKTPEMEALSEQTHRDIESLEKLLDGEGKKILERLLDNSAELERWLVCEGFKDGFRLGVQPTAAGLEGGNSYNVHNFPGESLCSIYP